MAEAPLAPCSDAQMSTPSTPAPTEAPIALDDRHFRTDHLLADLKGRSVRGGAVTLSAQVVKFALQLGSTAVLARLLTPADFGLVAMVAAFTGFIGLFKDLGLSLATVQRAEITHQQVSTLFWINVAASAVLMGLAAALSPMVAWFYGEPRLTAIMLVVAGTFIFGGLTAQHSALLRRQMRFKELAAIEVLSLAFGIAVAITMAVMGCSYWSLVGLPVGTAAADCALAWLYSGWRPGWPVRRCGVGPMIRFGGNLTGFNTINYFSRNADNIMIGATWGAGALGIYSKAYGLLLLPLRQINAPMASVAIPSLSRLQEDPAAFRQYYCRAIELLAYVTMPLVVLMAILAHDLVHLILGAQWLEVVPVFIVFAVFGIIQSVSVTSGWVLSALGRTRRMLKLTMYSTPCLLIAFAIGLPWGPLGVAAAATTCALVLVGPQMFYAYRHTPVTVGSVAAAIRSPFLLSMMILAIAAPIRWLMEQQSAFPGAVIAACAAAVVVAVWFAILPADRRSLAQVLSIIVRRR